ncbi:MAG: sulfotransferase domain-containing protein, partial [Marinoscillum sp.]
MKNKSKRMIKYANWSLHEKKESVFFYTFHKCASTLFGKYVLNNVDGLWHVDYSDKIALGSSVQPTFKEKGYIYGPIRLSASPEFDVYKRLVGPTSSPEFIADKKAIFMIRDPRDILVSGYYSYGWTHRLNPNEKRRGAQLQKRDKVQSMTLDEYALETVQDIKSHFVLLKSLSEACPRSEVLRYEDMIDDCSTFSAQITKVLDVKPAVLTEMYRRSRPKETEDIGSHTRSGKTRSFEEKLKT